MTDATPGRTAMTDETLGRSVMAEPTTSESTTSEPAESEPTAPRRSLEDRFPRGLWVRLIIYIAVGHLLAAFIYLLFELGARSQ